MAGRGVCLYDPKGQPQRMLGIILDITERKRAEELLKQLNATLERRVTERTAELPDAYERHRAITDNALVGILTLNERGLIETLNPAAALIFGYSPGEIPGRNVSRFMASPDQVQGEVFLAHYIQSGGQRFMGRRAQVLGRRKDGHAIMLELTVGDFTQGGRGNASRWCGTSPSASAWSGNCWKSASASGSSSGTICTTGWGSTCTGSPIWQSCWKRTFSKTLPPAPRRPAS